MLGQKNSSRERVTDYAALALVSASVIVVEIAYTRVLSVVLWYHMAFACVSLALLGLGAPGVWFTLRRPGPRLLPRLLLLAAVVLPLSIAVILRVGPAYRAWLVEIVVVSVLVPFLVLGAAIVLLLLRAPDGKVGTYYAADLAGAAVGALCVVPLMTGVPTPHLIAAAALLPILAAMLIGDSRERVMAVVALFLLSGSFLQEEPYKLEYTKSYDERRMYGARTYERWTPTARLAVFEGFFGNAKSPQFLWGAGARKKFGSSEFLWLEQDGNAGTPILRFEGDLNTMRYLLEDVTALGYLVRDPKRAAVIGAGGGRDILTALVAGVTDVDAVEINAGIVEAMKGPFLDYSGNVYNLSAVHTVVSEGRSFLTRTEKTYDVIQISMIDSWASTAAGAYALSENNLYTVEAFELYLKRLSPSGLVAATRWARGETMFESARLALLAEEALRQSDVADPHAHLAVVRGGQVATLLVSRRPFSSPDIARLETLSEARGFEVLFAGRERKNAVALALSMGPVARTKDTRVDHTPPTDDRPFFFFLHSVSQIAGAPQQVRTLQTAVATPAYLALVLFMFPFTRLRFPERRRLVRGSGYFVGIGAAFMFVEIPLIQQFVLYLGHPSYATTVVLAGLLCGAGAGSFQTRRPGSRGWMLMTLLVLATLNMALPHLFALTLGSPMLVRVCVSLSILVGTGYLLGRWLPFGMSHFGDANRAWYWALNGVAGVFAAAFSIALALAFGFSVVFIVGIAAYAAAFLCTGKHHAIHSDRRAVSQLE